MAKTQDGLTMIPSYLGLFSKITMTNLSSLLQMQRTFERAASDNKARGITDTQLTDALRDVEAAIKLVGRIKFY